MEGTGRERQDRHARTGPVFAGTDPVTLEQVAELSDVEEVAAGTTLTHEGRHEGYFYMIVAGTVEVSRGGEVIDPSGHGSFIGEISLLDLGPRTATAKTLTPCLLLRVNSAGFEALLETDPAVRKAQPRPLDAWNGWIPLAVPETAQACNARARWPNAERRLPTA